MTLSRNITKNSIYNLLGSGLPIFIGIATIPRLVHALGVDRYGILTLTWVVMGYFSLFDLGLGRALTQIVSERSGMEAQDDLPDIIRTALILMLLLGMVGGVVLGAASPYLIGHVLKMPHNLHHEVLYAFILMAFSIPVVTVLAGLRGILEARQRFLELGVLRLSMGVLTFVGPWAITFVSINLFWVVMSLEVMRYGALAAYFLTCRALVPEMQRPAVFCSLHWKKLIKFGGWMTISNIISPLMVNMDRFFIGAFISIGAIAYYTTSFDMVIKVLLISGSIVTVLFPMFGSLHRSNPDEAVRLYRKGLRAIFLLLGPGLLLLAIGARLILFHWLGADFAEYGSAVLRILCLGVLINALASVPFAFVQGAARPDLTAKFHLAEVPIYLVILWLFGTHFGVEGVAWAWVIRVSLDFILLSVVAHRIQGHAQSSTGTSESGVPIEAGESK